MTKNNPNDIDLWSQAMRPRAYPTLHEILAQANQSPEFWANLARIWDGQIWSFAVLTRWDRLSTVWMRHPRRDQGSEVI